MRVFLHIARYVHFYGSGTGERVKKWKGEKMANATNVFGFASFIPYSFSLFHLFKVDKFVAKHLFTF